MIPKLSEQLRDYKPISGPESWAAPIVGMVLLASLCICLLPPGALIPGHQAFLFAIGTIALWRYGWGALHYLRAFAYLQFWFPAFRANIDSAPQRRPPLAAAVMSWRFSAAINATVYHAIIRDLVRYGAPSVLVASLSDPADARIVQDLLARYPEAQISLVTLFQKGTGKRPALAECLAVLRARDFPRHGAVVLMDGDSWIRPGSFERAVPVLFADDGIGAVTTANEPLVAGTPLAREWYRLRMAQRHIYMSSMSLSERVLVLTGRFSALRAEIALDPGFIANIETDSVHHDRLGRIQMLTGEDKSTWRWVLERGWKALYVPDVVIHPLEELPTGRFYHDSVSLMLRWMGNMMRAGHRAIRLGPGRLGLFPWLALIDQRVSIWTTLAGPSFFGLAAAVHDLRYIAVYALWVMLSRSVLVGVQALVTGKFHPWFVPLVFYSQMSGAAVKAFVFFHPYVQRWTRQNTGSAGGATLSFGSWLLMAASLLLYLALIALISGIFENRAGFDLRALAAG
jgi:glycosyltransferase Alg8